MSRIHDHAQQRSRTVEVGFLDAFQNISDRERKPFYERFARGVDGDQRASRLHKCLYGIHPNGTKPADILRRVWLLIAVLLGVAVEEIVHLLVWEKDRIEALSEIAL